MKRRVSHCHAGLNLSFKALLLCALLICCNLAMGEEKPAPGIKEQFEQKISELLGVPVAVKDYKLSYATVILTGVKIGAQAQSELPSAEIKELSATCDMMSLLGGNLVMKEIKVKSMKAAITLDSNGKPILGAISRPPSPGPALSIENLPFDKLSVSKLELRIIAKKSGKTVLMQMPSATVARSESGSPLNIDFAGSLSLAGANKAGTTAELPFKAEIKMQALKPLQASGAAAIKPASVETLVAVIGALAPGHIDGLSMAGGQTSAELKFAGAADKPMQFSFNADLKNIDSLVYNASPEIKKFSAQLSMIGKVADGSISSAIGISDAALVIPSRKIDINKALIKLRVESAPENLSLTGSASVPRFDFDLPVSSTNRSSYLFPFIDVSSSFSYSGDVFTISSAQAKLFGGSLSGSGKVFTGKTPVRLQVNAKGSGLRAESFLDSNTTQKQVITGPAGGTFNADGDIETLSSWNGTGSLHMQNGRYNTPPVVTPFLSLVNLKEYSSGDISEASATFVIRQGIMTTDDMMFLSSAGRASYRGDVGLDTSLKGNLEIRFAPVAVEKSRVLQQISLDGKTASIPSRVEGTLLAPVFPGFKPEKLLELGLKRQGQKLLQDILKPRSKEPASAEPAPAAKKTDPAKDLLKDLGNIFKRRRK
ncbi:MAG TPA: AsmA-like C-terminal region-containing protein [Candidatus Ozemobacteraceae bacterium]|nr:AsmA-like C-terminal region-containing protein [Candidatus Ozemobacteraceae bacterium]